MKIKLIVLPLLLLFLTGLKAQQIGVRAGVNLNSSKVDYENIDAKFRTGFNVGAISDFNLPLDGWKLNTGLLYNYQGFSLRQDRGNNQGISYYFNTNNLELPINIRKEFDLHAIKPFIQGGVYGSYVLSGRIKDGDSSQTMKFKKNGDKLDIGMNFGAGCYLTTKLRLVANYGFGFKERQIVFGDQFVSYKNASWSLSAEYIF